MAATHREPQRVLVYRLGSLGDHAVALPCYRLVARAFPGAERRLLTNFPVAQKAAAAEAVIGASGLIDGYMSYTVGERDWRALLRLVREIRGWRPDVLVYLAGARGPAGGAAGQVVFQGVRSAAHRGAAAECGAAGKSAAGRARGRALV